MIWRGPMVMSALTQMLREVAWGELDVLVVDMPPGTGDAQLTMAQQVPLAGAVIVSTPQDLALIDARKGLNMFRRVDVPVLGHRREHELLHLPALRRAQRHLRPWRRARREAARLGVPFLGEVPLHMAIRELSDAGTPVVVSEPEGEHASIYRDIAAATWERVRAARGAAGRRPPRIVVETRHPRTASGVAPLPARRSFGDTEGKPNGHVGPVSKREGLDDGKTGIGWDLRPGGFDVVRANLRTRAGRRRRAGRPLSGARRLLRRLRRPRPSRPAGARAGRRRRRRPRRAGRRTGRARLGQGRSPSRSSGRSRRRRPRGSPLARRRARAGRQGGARPARRRMPS